MTAERQQAPNIQTQRLPPHVAILGVVSLLTAMSSTMVYSLLPVFLVRVLGATMTSVGFIEKAAEDLMSFARIGSGVPSDWTSRRRPLVLRNKGPTDSRIVDAESGASIALLPLQPKRFSPIALRNIAGREKNGLRHGRIQF